MKLKPDVPAKENGAVPRLDAAAPSCCGALNVKPVPPADTELSALATEAAVELEHVDTGELKLNGATTHVA